MIFWVNNSGMGINVYLIFHSSLIVKVHVKIYKDSIFYVYLFEIFFDLQKKIYVPFDVTTFTIEGLFTIFILFYGGLNW